MRVPNFRGGIGNSRPAVTSFRRQAPRVACYAVAFSVWLTSVALGAAAGTGRGGGTAARFHRGGTGIVRNAGPVVFNSHRGRAAIVHNSRLVVFDFDRRGAAIVRDARPMVFNRDRSIGFRGGRPIRHWGFANRHDGRGYYGDAYRGDGRNFSSYGYGPDADYGGVYPAYPYGAALAGGGSSSPGYADGYPYTYNCGDHSASNDGVAANSQTQVTADVVAAVQTKLTRQAYYDGRLHGILTGDTRSAIREYQTDHALPVDGEITPELLASMSIR